MVADETACRRVEDEAHAAAADTPPEITLNLVRPQAGEPCVLIAEDDPHAAEAVDLFVYRIGREIGSLAAALGGVDALVFTGGIGENSAVIRERVCLHAAWLGPVRAHVIPTDEELMIANHTRQVLGLSGATP